MLTKVGATFMDLLGLCGHKTKITIIIDAFDNDALKFDNGSSF